MCRLHSSGPSPVIPEVWQGEHRQPEERRSGPKDRCSCRKAGGGGHGARDAKGQQGRKADKAVGGSARRARATCPRSSEGAAAAHGAEEDGGGRLGASGTGQARHQRGKAMEDAGSNFRGPRQSEVRAQNRGLQCDSGHPGFGGSRNRTDRLTTYSR